MGSSTDSADSPAEQGLALKITCTEELGHTPVPVSHSIQSENDTSITTLSQEAPVSINGAKEMACPISCAEEQTLFTDRVAESAASISSTEEGLSASIAAPPALTSTCSQSPHLTRDYADQNHQQTKKRKKGKNKVTLRSATLSDFCQEVAVLTLDPPDETPAQNIGHMDETPTQNLSYAEVVLACNVRSTGQTPALNITCARKAPAHNIRSDEQQVSLRVKSSTSTIDCTGQQRLEQLDSRTSLEDGKDQDATPRILLNYSVLGLPNIGNSCYMNATLQSLFSLPTFTQDIRGEVDFGSSQLLKCLADLQAARSSSSRRQKISLLGALKQSIAADCSDFSGSEKQDAHEFLGVLLCQFKEAQVSLRRTAGDLPCNKTIESNFEFELRSTRACLSCGKKFSHTELYNCLSLDLVPGGSIQDSLGLYFMGCEVECKCLWCSGHLATMEQKLLSLPRVLVVQLKRFSANTKGHLVKLHDRVRISPQLSLQPHSSATVRVPELPKTHLTDAAPCTAEKRTTLEGSSSIRVEDSCSVAEYRVTSVLSHIGSNMRHGHYICESRQRDERWLLFDDEKVVELDQRTVLRRRSNSAYLLFYEFRDLDDPSGLGAQSIHHEEERNRRGQGLEDVPREQQWSRFVTDVASPYISGLIHHLECRFENLDLLGAFSVLGPQATSQSDEQNNAHRKILANRFLPGNEMSFRSTSPLQSISTEDNNSRTRARLTY
ncbi:hypothetical protein GJAV_G00184060 [Gymnothorax javanicus]|nr:hypothetical protein GJAV_G00184060 [Gymnothorax javanicus]